MYFGTMLVYLKYFLSCLFLYFIDSGLFAVFFRVTVVDYPVKEPYAIQHVYELVIFYNINEVILA